MKLKITGRNDNLKDIARLLIDQYIGFKFDGENKIVADHHLSDRGFELVEKFKEYCPNVTVVKMESKTRKVGV